MQATSKRIRRSINLALSLLACSSLIANPFDLSDGKKASAAPAKLSMVGADAKEESKQAITGNGSGTLIAMMPGGKRLGQCPLKHTDVKASVAGYVTRVNVKQTFHNPYKNKIEAIYTFPLPENAAVDEMTMKIGSRIIKGNIKKKEEAKEIYEAARAAGHVASLLDQERPNIFTQSVANIEPGETVEIEIKYVDLLAYESGSYSFNFPTVVGPRFNPGTQTVGKTGRGRDEDTDQVPDASKITPQIAPKGERAGHDISISLDIDAGVPINAISSKLHEVQNKIQGNSAHIELVNKATIPNRDFVLSWSVAADKLQSGYLTHHDKQGGFFTLMLLPPKKVTVNEIAPKEMVFLVDTSGSQSGAPLDKAKETLNYILEHMNPNDTFQIIAFSDGQTFFAPKPQVASAEMKQRAKRFISALQANGGTWMGPAVEKVCALPNDEHRLRIVTFMTDGYVGNDMEILGMIHKYRDKSRWFPFGTGNSVNRFLIDGIAKEGGGEADYVLLNSPGNVVGKKFYDKISSPLLTDVKVEFNGLEVKEVFPKEISDVWAEKPLYIKGRYLKPGAGTITLTGYAGGKPYTQTLKVNFPENQSANEAIKPIWARAKVDRLMSEDWMGAQRGQNNKELKEEVVKTALDYHIMTQYTSFVAVEEKRVTKGGVMQTVDVPVELPDGVDREATLGEEDSSDAGMNYSSGKTLVRSKRRAMYSPRGGAQLAPMAMAPSPSPMPMSMKSSGMYSKLAPAPAPTRAGRGGGSGSGGGSAGGGIAGGASGLALPTPVSSTAVRGQLLNETAEKKAEHSAKPGKDGDDKSDKNKETNAAKIDTLLAQLIDGQQPSKAVDVQNGKVMVKVKLSNLNQDTLKQLKELGLAIVVSNVGDKSLVGWIKIEKLEELSNLNSVLKIEPARSNK